MNDLDEIARAVTQNPNATWDGLTGTDRVAGLALARKLGIETEPPKPPSQSAALGGTQVINGVRYVPVVENGQLTGYTNQSTGAFVPVGQLPAQQSNVSVNVQNAPTSSNATMSREQVDNAIKAAGGKVILDAGDLIVANINGREVTYNATGFRDGRQVFAASGGGPVKPPANADARVTRTQNVINAIQGSRSQGQPAGAPSQGEAPVPPRDPIAIASSSNYSPTNQDQQWGELMPTLGGARVPSMAFEKDAPAYGQGQPGGASTFLSPTALGFDPIAILRGAGEAPLVGAITPEKVERALNILGMQQANPNLRTTQDVVNNLEGRPNPTASQKFQNAMREGRESANVFNRATKGEGVTTFPQGVQWYDPRVNAMLWEGIERPLFHDPAGSDIPKDEYGQPMFLAEGGSVYAGVDDDDDGDMTARGMGRPQKPKRNTIGLPMKGSAKWMGDRRQSDDFIKIQQAYAAIPTASGEGFTIAPWLISALRQGQLGSGMIAPNFMGTAPLTAKFKGGGNVYSSGANVPFNPWADDEGNPLSGASSPSASTPQTPTVASSVPATTPPAAAAPSDPFKTTLNTEGNTPETQAYLQARMNETQTRQGEAQRLQAASQNMRYGNRYQSAGVEAPWVSIPREIELQRQARQPQLDALAIIAQAADPSFRSRMTSATISHAVGQTVQANQAAIDYYLGLPGIVQQQYEQSNPGADIGTLAQMAAADAGMRFEHGGQVMAGGMGNGVAGTPGGPQQMVANEPIIGMGMQSQQPRFVLGEAGPEMMNIVPMNGQQQKPQPLPLGSTGAPAMDAIAMAWKMKNARMPQYRVA